MFSRFHSRFNALLDGIHKAYRASSSGVSGFTVLDQDGNSFSVDNDVLDADGNTHTVGQTVLDQDGNTHEPT